jgi:hypothetical protein
MLTYGYMTGFAHRTTGKALPLSQIVPHPLINPPTLSAPERYEEDRGGGGGGSYGGGWGMEGGGGYGGMEDGGHGFDEYEGIRGGGHALGGGAGTEGPVGGEGGDPTGFEGLSDEELMARLSAMRAQLDIPSQLDAPPPSQARKSFFF